MATPKDARREERERIALLTIAAAAGVPIAVAAVAGYLPAMRAMRVDPVVALRDE